MARRLQLIGWDDTPKIFNIRRERIAMWKKVLFCIVSIMSLALSACNTMQGAGRDVERAGQKVQDEAQEHKHY